MLVTTLTPCKYNPVLGIGVLESGLWGKSLQANKGLGLTV